MFEIVFENAEFVAVDKPSGWLTVPSRFEKEDARKVLGRELERELNIRLFPVHRLDFEVSGLVVFAKTAAAHRVAGGWFERHRIQKTYEGLSRARDFSHWPENLKAERDEVPVGIQQKWTSRILRGKRRSYEHPKGDPSSTRATLSGQDFAERLQWILQPETGRSHQLRFEMSRHGFPLLGDRLYGSKESWEGPDRIALRAVSLDLSGIGADERRGLPESLFVKGLFS